MAQKEHGEPGGTAIMPLAVYTSSEAAGLMRLSVRTLRTLVKEGRISPQRYTRKHLFFGRDLLRCLEVESGTGESA